MTDLGRWNLVGAMSVFYRWASSGALVLLSLMVSLSVWPQAHAAEGDAWREFIDHCLDPVLEKEEPNLTGLLLIEGEIGTGIVEVPDDLFTRYGPDATGAETPNWILIRISGAPGCSFAVHEQTFDEFADFVVRVRTAKSGLFQALETPSIEDLDYSTRIPQHLKSTAAEVRAGEYIYFSVRFLIDYFVVTILPFEERSDYCELRPEECA